MSKGSKRRPAAVGGSYENNYDRIFRQIKSVEEQTNVVAKPENAGVEVATPVIPNKQ